MQNIQEDETFILRQVRGCSWSTHLDTVTLLARVPFMVMKIKYCRRGYSGWLFRVIWKTVISKDDYHNKM